MAACAGTRCGGVNGLVGAAAIVYAGAIGADVPGSLSIKHTTIRDNAVQAIATGSASGQPGAFVAASGALDLALQTTISRTTISGNTVSATAHAGRVLAVSGAVSGIAQADASVSISASLLEQNHVSAVSTHGTAIAYGGATQNSAPMMLTDVTVSGNTVTAAGDSGAAYGGGIYNGPVPDLQTPIKLTLTRAVIVTNLAATSGQLRAAGGGLYTTAPVPRTATVIAGNRPNQCSGC